MCTTIRHKKHFFSLSSIQQDSGSGFFILVLECFNETILDSSLFQSSLNFTNLTCQQVQVINFDRASNFAALRPLWKTQSSIWNPLSYILSFNYLMRFFFQMFRLFLDIYQEQQATMICKFKCGHKKMLWKNETCIFF